MSGYVQNTTNNGKSIFITTRNNFNKIRNSDVNLNALDKSEIKSKLKTKLQQLKNENPDSDFVVNWILDNGGQSSQISNNINYLLEDPHVDMYYGIETDPDSNKINGHDIIGAYIKVID